MSRYTSLVPVKPPLTCTSYADHCMALLCAVESASSTGPDCWALSFATLLQEYFTKFGYVLDVYMPRDKVKRSEHRGFGFVTFETEAAIQRIAQHGPHQIK